MYSYTSLSVALGLDPETRELQKKLKDVFGNDWKEKLGTR